MSNGATSVSVGFKPVSVLGHLVLDGTEQDELTTLAVDVAESPVGVVQRWEGPLGLIGHATSDKRFLLPGEIGQRTLPRPLQVQPETNNGHDGSLTAGSIETIELIPVSDFSRAEEFGLSEVPEDAVVIFATGTLDGSPAAEEAARMIANGAGVSLDITHDRLALLDPETLEEIPEADIDMERVLGNEYITGIGGKIAAATVLSIGAFEEASVRIIDGEALVASAMSLKLAAPPRELVAAGGIQKPPRSAFENPNLARLTALQIQGRRVFGHLADWTGCHTGFSNVCVPPFDTQTDFAYFHVGEIETEEGDLLPVGKLMFSMDDKVGHADARPGVLDAAAASRFYDKSHNVGAYVRAGRDQHGIWLAGWLRDGLTDAEVQHLRAHPPSGDWRPIPGTGASELVAAFAVAVPGFPIQRALVASAGEGELTLITGPLQVEPPSARTLRRQWAMLRSRRAELMPFIAVDGESGETLAR